MKRIVILITLASSMPLYCNDPVPPQQPSIIETTQALIVIGLLLFLRWKVEETFNNDFPRASDIRAQEEMKKLNERYFISDNIDSQLILAPKVRVICAEQQCPQEIKEALNIK